ncbi:MAG: dienelactone hydrolase family protein [Pseudomonadota bacterium]
MTIARRTFLQLGAGATAAASLSTTTLSAALAAGPAGAAMPGFRANPPEHERALVATAEGRCPVHIFKPEGAGPWPGALLLPDGFGIRPTLFQLAQRLADGGYVVLLPDLFYRHGPYAPLDVKKVFAGENPRQLVSAAVGESPSNPMASRDAGPLLDYLLARPDVKGKKVGVTGYCMSGGMALTIAADYPDRIAAAASFHGGTLATDADSSPHWLAARMRARIYVAGAETDRFYPPEMAARLEKALTEAGVNHSCEIYPGTLHGWVMPDSPAYHEQGAERHWRQLFALFAATL